MLSANINMCNGGYVHVYSDHSSHLRVRLHGDDPTREYTVWVGSDECEQIREALSAVLRHALARRLQYIDEQMDVVYAQMRDGSSED